MVRAEDVANTQFKEKPYNSILPYLRSKQAEKVEANKKPATDRSELDNPTNFRAFYTSAE